MQMPTLDSGLWAKGYSLRLVLVRHGQPEQAVQGKCYGSLNVGLSDIGRAQMETKLSSLGNFSAEALYASPLRRAAESAAIAAAYFRLKPTLTPELKEIDFGSFEGLAYDEIEKLYPEEYKLWMECPTGIKFPQGESFAELKARVLRFKTFLLDAHDQQTVVLICHGGTNRVLLAEAMGVPDERIFRIDQGYAAINIIDYFDECPVVRLVNG